MKRVIIFFTVLFAIGFFIFVINQYIYRSKALETPVPLSILLPLYKYPEYQYWAKDAAGQCPSLPANIWDDVSRAALANKNTPIITIINPANGPGANGMPDVNYICGMNDLSTAVNIKMIGYIHTRTNTTSCSNLRNINDLKIEVGKYRANFPHVTGIFVDEVCNGNLSYYQNLYRAIKEVAPSYDLVVLNPGTIIDSNYITNNTGNLFVVYEGLSAGWNLPSTTNQIEALNTSKKTTLIYDVPTLINAKLIVDLALLRHYSHVYITDDILIPNPWDSLPFYWNEMVEYINSINTHISSSSSSSTPHFSSSSSSSNPSSSSSSSTFPITSSSSSIPRSSSSSSTGLCLKKSLGDANCDNIIDPLDYSIWLNHQCIHEPGQTCSDLRADFNDDSQVDDVTDYKIWDTNKTIF